MKKVEYLQYDWDEVGSKLLEQAVSKINELVDAVDELQAKQALSHSEESEGKHCEMAHLENQCDYHCHQPAGGGNMYKPTKKLMEKVNFTFETETCPTCKMIRNAHDGIKKHGSKWCMEICSHHLRQQLKLVQTKGE